MAETETNKAVGSSDAGHSPGTGRRCGRDAGVRGVSEAVLGSGVAVYRSSICRNCGRLGVVGQGGRGGIGALPFGTSGESENAAGPSRR